MPGFDPGPLARTNHKLPRAILSRRLKVAPESLWFFRAGAFARNGSPPELEDTSIMSKAAPRWEQMFQSQVQAKVTTYW